MPNFTEDNDFLNRSTILLRSHVAREVFDPENQEHLASLKRFIESGNWGKIQFYCEFPFTDVPMTVLMRFAGHSLGASRDTVARRLERIQKEQSGSKDNPE